MLKIDLGFIDFIKYAVVLSVCINFDVRAADKFNLKFYQEKDFYRPKLLSNDQMLTLAGLSDENRFKNILSKILIPRVPGTSEHEQVKDFLANSLRDLNWSVEIDEFSQYIPNQKKEVKFSTVIGRLNNDASRYLVLACHYDSKYMKDQVFYAATDSAVPCAMLLDIALSLNEYLKPYRSKDLSLMFIFFDGEEAFDKWGPNDSIYGARHLAKLWQDEPFPVDNANQLQRMDVLMLLDLLGAPNPKFYFYQAQTRHLHYLLADIQNKLDNLNELKDYSKSSKYFLKQKSYGFIEDDHLPFMLAQTPVPILHIIPQPFPGVWHTLKDDHTALDFPTIDNLNKIFRIFTLCYLRGSFDEDAYRRSLNSDGAKTEL